MTRHRILRIKPHVRTASMQFTVVLIALIAFASDSPHADNSQPAVRPGVPLVALQAVPPATSRTSGHQNENARSAAPTPSSPLFEPAVAYSSAGSAHSIAIADFNADGKLDVAVATGSSVAVLLGNGDGTFKNVQSYTSSAYDATSVAVGDMNSDGKLDLIVSYQQSSIGSQYGAVGVFLGNGDGTFQSGKTYETGGIHALDVAVGDVNGDGKLDVMVTNACPFNDDCSQEGSVSVLLGNGNGTLQAAQFVGSGGYFPVSILAADLNGDGKLDLVIVNLIGDNESQEVAAVLLGNGNGTFQAAQNYSLGGSGQSIFSASVALADVNGDRKPDLLASSQCIDVSCDQGAVSVLLGNGDGTFQSAQTYGSGGRYASGVAVGDVNGDGTLDLVVANDCSIVNSCVLGFQASADGTISVLLGNSKGTFQAAQTYDSGGWGASGVAVGDFNGNGKLDLVTSNACGVTCVGGDGVVGVLLSYNGKPATTTILTSSANPSMENQTITYTATVEPSSGEPVTGTVIFEDSWAPVATVNIVDNHAAYSASYPKVSVHPFTAVYSGDANNAESSSGTLVESVADGLTKTMTSLTSTVSPSLIGQPVTFTAAVTWNYGAVPNGQLVTFYDGSTQVGTATTTSGVAAFTTASLTAKTHTIKASYAGDATFAPSLGTVTQTVEKYVTATTLASSPNPSVYGQTVTWTVRTTTSGTLTPTGEVSLKGGGYTFGPITLNSSGVATLSKSTLNVDSYPLAAMYAGNASDAGSTSAILTQVVEEATSAATLGSSPNPSSQGELVTFTANITSPTVILVRGSVTFMAGETVLGTAELSGGKAQLKTSSLAVGSTTVTVTYVGDSNIANSSASFTQIVQ